MCSLALSRCIELLSCSGKKRSIVGEDDMGLGSDILELARRLKDPIKLLHTNTQCGIGLVTQIYRHGNSSLDQSLPIPH